MDEKEVDLRDEQATVREEQSEIRELLFEEHHATLIRYMRVIFWVTVVLIVLAFVGLIRSFVLQGSVDTLNRNTANLEEETNQARTAAVEARDALVSALEEAEQRRLAGGNLPPAAIRDALIAVSRIETHLCGGPCGSVREEG
jgi:hypothetical protein